MRLEDYFFLSQYPNARYLFMKDIAISGCWTRSSTMRSLARKNQSLFD